MTMNEGALEMVRHGFSDCRGNDVGDDPFDSRCLHFRVSFSLGYGDTSGLSEVGQALDIIGGYNAFNADTVKRALDSVASHLHSYPGIEVGREGSPVLYLYADSDEGVKAVMKAMTEAHADEVDVVQKSPVGQGACVRAWWD